MLSLSRLRDDTAAHSSSPSSTRRPILDRSNSLASLPPEQPPNPTLHRQNRPPRKPRRQPHTPDNPNRQQNLRNRIRRRQLQHNPDPLLPSSPILLPPRILADPPFLAHPVPEHHLVLVDPFVLADVGWQPVGVVENSGEAEERDYGGEFVQDEEGGYVGDGRGAEGLKVAGEEVWEA